MYQIGNNVTESFNFLFLFIFIVPPHYLSFHHFVIASFTVIVVSEQKLFLLIKMGQWTGSGTRPQGPPVFLLDNPLLPRA